MAGIGFRLQNILRENSYKALMKAYLYSAVISSGPWLLSICGIFLIGILSGMLSLSENLPLFRGVIVYVYAGTLILTGAVQMGTTRYIADRLFVHDTAALKPCYHFVALLVVVFGGVLATLFFFASGLSAASALAAVVMFQMVSLTWIGMVFLSAAKDYAAIVRAFAVGYGMSVVFTTCGGILARDYTLGEELSYMLWGFTLGQATLATLLGIRIRVEFPSPRNWDANVQFHWRALPLLAVIGFFYNLGVWVDKILFWLGPTSEYLRAGTWFYMAPDYDICIYAGYLTTVPAMSIFLIRIETGFYKHYLVFFKSITEGGSLREIENDHRAIVNALRLSATRLLKQQGGISLALIALAPVWVPWIGLSGALVPLMRVAIIAAFLQVMLLILFILFLYFDWQRTAAVLSILFFLFNGFFTWVSFSFDGRYAGLGYLGACLLTLLIGLYVFEQKMKGLIYETFTRQPWVA